MIKIFSEIFKWVAWKAVTLLLILAVLLGAYWINGELKTENAWKRDRVALVKQKDARSKEMSDLRRTADEKSKRAGSYLQDPQSTLKGKQGERQTLWEEHFWTRNIPLSDAWQQIQFLDAEIAAIRKVIKSEESVQKQLDVIFIQIGTIDRQIEDVDKKLNKSFGSQILSVVRNDLPIALGILIGIILVPIGIKVTLYYIVARWVEGRPPIRLLPSASGSILAVPTEGSAGNDRGRISSVSRPIVLGESQELLVQPGYLQSTSLQAKKETKWLLNASIPFSSLLSGMFMLTRVGPAGSAPVVISSTKDPFSEIGIIDLADGAAFVCQPRSLVGVIQNPGKPIRITRHWRLGSLQSWLTLQLRFLVFHGPGQLVMKGCRGIRIESPSAGRLINQAATLGFSANIAYANTRCETFVSYWAGKEDLFNDLFTGESGVYVYEETPGSRRTTGGERHLEGFVDGILKVFGV